MIVVLLVIVLFVATFIPVSAIEERYPRFSLEYWVCHTVRALSVIVCLVCLVYGPDTHNPIPRFTPAEWIAMKGIDIPEGLR